MADINSLQDFANGQIVNAESLNTIKNAAKDAYNTTKKFVNINIQNINNVGNANAYVDSVTGNLVLENLKGDKGNQGDRGEKGNSPVIKTSLYQSSVTYVNQDDKIDFVTYGGSTYAPLPNTSVTNVLPTDTSKWTLIAEKGKDGKGGNITITNFNLVDLNKQYIIQPTTKDSSTISAMLVESVGINTDDFVKKNQGKANKILITRENGYVNTGVALEIGTVLNQLAPSSELIEGGIYLKKIRE